ncbi:PREDICTED: uncharacterized protein LOC106807120 [Priapulus caudatus]|uniref:Uncharacterized protein LOC106807120 n=1 Tax=Priapulus caudatus TaxID=37621 RepID=A0ABM1DY46_PRICU|nr:PREDICTED: uncharacterized protein LOC106807120 [Priapulus caudatus]
MYVNRASRLVAICMSFMVINECAAVATSNVPCGTEKGDPCDKGLMCAGWMIPGGNELPGLCVDSLNLNQKIERDLPKIRVSDMIATASPGSEAINHDSKQQHQPSFADAYNAYYT